MLKGKNIVVCLSGGIAVYKMCDVVSKLKKLSANVDVIMTESATKFVAPLTFETLSQNMVTTDMFKEKYTYDVSHISLAKKADLFIIAPATANVIAKLACGIADDMLTTTVLATRAKTLVCPSMNTNMYENPVTLKNIQTLASRGFEILEADTGLLACGDIGKGKLPTPDTIVEKIMATLSKPQDFFGKRVLVTAGATIESIDGVRYITNHSSGKMGVAIAKALIERGAEVAMVVGKVSVDIPSGVKAVKVSTTLEMMDAVLKLTPNSDIIIKAAAPADYRPKEISKNKIKSADLKVEFTKNPDIAKAVGEIKGERKLVVFCAETEDLIANAIKKLESKNADLIVANDVTKEGAGFNVDTNIVTILGRDGSREDSGIKSKDDIANLILDNILKLYKS